MAPRATCFVRTVHSRLELARKLILSIRSGAAPRDLATLYYIASAPRICVILRYVPPNCPIALSLSSLVYVMRLNVSFLLPLLHLVCLLAEALDSYKHSWYPSYYKQALTDIS